MPFFINQDEIDIGFSDKQFMDGSGNLIITDVVEAAKLAVKDFIPAAQSETGCQLCKGACSKFTK